MTRAQLTKKEKYGALGWDFIRLDKGAYQCTKGIPTLRYDYFQFTQRDIEKCFKVIDKIEELNKYKK